MGENVESNREGERVWVFGERCVMVAGFLFQRLFGRVDAC